MLYYYIRENNFRAFSAHENIFYNEKSELRYWLYSAILHCYIDYQFIY